MKTFRFLLSAFLLPVIACNNTSQKKDDGLARLKHQKYAIDSAINAESLLLYLKAKGEKELIPAEKGRNRKNIETAYNVFKDPSGKVIYIAELPFSAKDDWFISYKSYFDKEGKLVAFQRQNNFFGSKCTKGAAMENLIRYYNPDFSVADSSYTLTDTKKNPLDKASCKFPYNFPFKVSKSLSEYRKERGIREF